MTAILDEQL